MPWRCSAPNPPVARRRDRRWRRGSGSCRTRRRRPGRRTSSRPRAGRGAGCRSTRSRSARHHRGAGASALRCRAVPASATPYRRPCQSRRACRGARSQSLHRRPCRLALPSSPRTGRQRGSKRARLGVGGVEGRVGVPAGAGDSPFPDGAGTCAGAVSPTSTHWPVSWSYSSDRDHVPGPDSRLSKSPPNGMPANGEAPPPFCVICSRRRCSSSFRSRWRRVERLTLITSSTSSTPRIASVATI